VARGIRVSRFCHWGINMSHERDELDGLEERFFKTVDEAAEQIKKEKEAKAANGKGEQDKIETQAQQLTKIAAASGLFHAPDGTGYADLIINGHRETWRIRSKAFREWLTREFFERDGGVPNATAMEGALRLIEAKARFEGPERKVFTRIAGLAAGDSGKIYLDLADAGWNAIEIDADGWRLVNEPTVRFRRAGGMLPLPMPERGGRIEDLRPFLNVKDDDDFVLAVAWLLAALRDCGPYPVLALTGVQGAAKSTFTRLLRGLVDPNTASLRALPREDRDLFIAATNSYVLAFDNVSGLPAWLSIRYADSRPAAVSPRASCIPTATKCCSMLVGRSFSMGSRISLPGPTSPTEASSLGWPRSQRRSAKRKPHCSRTLRRRGRKS
jgi:hypothetical protein